MKKRAKRASRRSTPRYPSGSPPCRLSVRAIFTYPPASRGRPWSSRNGGLAQPLFEGFGLAVQGIVAKDRARKVGIETTNCHIRIGGEAGIKILHAHNTPRLIPIRGGWTVRRADVEPAPGHH